jgi:hypothetical protein
MGMPEKLPGAFCAAVLVGILIAGLWPFHEPKNEVTWLPDDNGLHFGTYGVMLSPDAFSSASSKDGSSCSVEIWLQPAVIEGSTILAFYKPENLSVTFSLHQSIDDLLLRRTTGYRQGRRKTRMYIEHLSARTSKYLSRSAQTGKAQQST